MSGAGGTGRGTQDDWRVRIYFRRRRVTHSGRAGHPYSARFNNFFQRQRRGFSRVRHRQIQLDGRVPQRDGTAQQQKLRTWCAHHAKFRLAVRRAGGKLMAKRVQRRERFHNNVGGIAHVRAGTYFQGNGIVVKGDGAHRRAKRKEKIAHAPSRRIRIVRIVTVVGDDIAVHFFQALGDGIIRHLRQNFLRRPVVLRFSSVRKFSVRKIRIAAPHKNQIARQISITAELPGRLQRGAELKRRPERGQCQRRGENFRVRRRSEKSVGVKLVQCFAGVAIRNQDAPKSFLRVRFIQRRIHACLKTRHIRARFSSVRAARGRLRGGGWLRLLTGGGTCQQKNQQSCRQRRRGKSQAIARTEEACRLIVDASRMVIRGSARRLII